MTVNKDGQLQTKAKNYGIPLLILEGIGFTRIALNRLLKKKLPDVILFDQQWIFLAASEYGSWYTKKENFLLRSIILAELTKSQFDF